MAQNKNTIPTRIHFELDKMIKQVQAKQLMKGKRVTSSRVSLAISRQFKVRPFMLKELEEADLR